MKKVAVVCTLAFVVASIVASSEQAQARPQYLKAFTEKYEKVADKAKETKCGVCHPEKSKKVQNDFGKALGKGIGAKNEKDAEKIAKGLDEAAKAKNKDGKTYGEVIESGELPN